MFGNVMASNSTMIGEIYRRFLLEIPKNAMKKYLEYTCLAMWWLLIPPWLNLEIAKNAMKTQRIIMFHKIKFSGSNLFETLLFEIPTMEWDTSASIYLGF